ncbi:MAG TPA: TetR/AcrR family transcriptional regulator [Spirochaetota bacterium]|nr:TetR/AcrR family transcriptional regulator [Spirochaetota bacterium]HPJ35835.1 TetR/AcrR family transcriptional regulator [Spirochaetota bacterium]
MARIVKNADERRGEIISAARELFQTKDYDKTTMQDIMNKLGIAKGTIYHYFSSKEDLLEAVIEDIVDEELRRKQELMNSDRVKKLPALEKLKVIITEDTIAEENDRILDSLHHHENTEMHTKQLGRYIVKLAPIWASIFIQGCEEGVFKTDYPLESAEFILAGVQFLTDKGFYPWTEGQLERRVRAFTSLIEAQLGAAEGSLSFIYDQIISP